MLAYTSPPDRPRIERAACCGFSSLRQVRANEVDRAAIPGRRDVRFEAGHRLRAGRYCQDMLSPGKLLSSVDREHITIATSDSAPVRWGNGLWRCEKEPDFRARPSSGPAGAG